MTIKITKPQRGYLEDMLAGPQPTHSNARTRCQNTLVRLGLARYVSGGEVTVSYVPGTCEITELGRQVLDGMKALELGRKR